MISHAHVIAAMGFLRNKISIHNKWMPCVKNLLFGVWWSEIFLDTDFTDNTGVYFL
jgi:hypothetical protein